MSRPSLADAIDLLDLVRVAEDSARISMDSLPPHMVEAAKGDAALAAPTEDFVDVGDEAEDVAPSVAPIAIETLDPSLLPPELRPKLANATSNGVSSSASVESDEDVESGDGVESVPPSAAAPVSAPASAPPKPIAVVSAPERSSPSGSPIAGILLVFGFAIAGLAGICALPSDPLPVAPVSPVEPKAAALRTEPTDLKVERNAEDRVEGVEDDVSGQPSH